MTLLQRLRALLGLSQNPQSNIIVDDLFQQFLNRSQHAEGNAVQMLVSSAAFTETNMGELMSADLIYGWYADDNGDYVLYSDRERLSRFDMEALRELDIAGLARSPQRPWWNIQ